MRFDTNSESPKRQANVEKKGMDDQLRTYSVGSSNFARFYILEGGCKLCCREIFTDVAVSSDGQTLF